MSYGSGSQMMRGQQTAAALVLLLAVLLGCHAFSAHCVRQLDVGGGGMKMLKPLPGKCVSSRCTQESLDSKIGCFCCLSTPENPCFLKEADCVKVCRPQVLPWSPPPPLGVLRSRPLVAPYV